MPLRPTKQTATMMYCQHNVYIYHKDTQMHACSAAHTHDILTAISQVLFRKCCGMLGYKETLHIELKDAQGRANGQKITGLDFLSGVTATTNFIISACKRDFIHAGMPDTETE